MANTINRGLPITGLAANNCLGPTTDHVRKSIMASRSGLGPPSIELPFETVCGSVAEEPQPLETRYSAYDSRQARTALQTLQEIRPQLDQALTRWGRDRVAMVVATSTGGIAGTETAHAAYLDSGHMPDGYSMESEHAFHAFARLIQVVSGLEGPVYVVSTACSSSSKVAGSAARLIRAGIADAVLIGGIDTLCLTTLCGFAGLGVLSPKACRPFSAERQGMNIGEGGAFLLVEREGEARARLLGVGESSDAHHMSSPHPEGLGARMAIEAALHSAGVSTDEIDYVNAHGTGTKLNDAAEAQAIASMLGTEVPVSSTKGFTGHMLGAAGATELVITVLALENGWIPSNLGAEPVDPAIALNVNTQWTRRQCRFAMSTSFGFGGSNCAVVLGAA